MAYKIELHFDKELPAYPKEGRLYKSKQNNKNTTVDSMITKSLDSSFKIINSSLCKDSKKELEYLFDLINNSSNVGFEIINLDSRGLWLTFKKAYKEINKQSLKDGKFNTIGDYINACIKYDLWTDQTRNINLNLFNICLVLKLNQPIHPDLNGLNTVVVFCDLVINKQDISNTNNIFTKLVVKRVELLELHASLSNNKEINIVINDNQIIDMDPEFYSDLCHIEPKVSFKNDSKLRKYLRYDDWTRFIFAIKAYYKNKNSEENNLNQILYSLEEDTYDIDTNISCYLLQSKNKTKISNNKRSKYFLINRDDENNKYQIKLEIQNDHSNSLLQSLDDKNQDLNAINDKLKTKNIDNEEMCNKHKKIKDEKIKNLEALKTSLQQIYITIQNTKVQKEKNEVTLSNLHNEKKEKIANKENSTFYQNEINDINLKISEINDELSKSNKDKNLEQEFNSKQKEIAQFESEISSIDKKISEIQKNIQDNLDSIDSNNKHIKKIWEQISTIKNEYQCYKISFSFEKEQKQTFVPLQLVNSTLSDDFKTANNFYIDEKDSGTLAILNRYTDGLEQIKSGYYKNPYLFYKLIEPEALTVNLTKEVNSKIINNYQLNDYQKLAVQKGINIDNFFYLQGPPGTGKTQTICAIANQYALENKTILMTSQSHEAINNFFDRLDETNNDNPLLVMIKYIANEEQNESNKYNIDYAWKRFVTKCINACDPLDDNNWFKQIINELEANDFVMPTFITKKESEIICDNTELVNQLSSMNRFINNSNINKIIEDKNSLDLSLTIEYFSTKHQRDYEHQELLEKYENLISELNNQNKLSKLFDSLDEIKSYLNKDKKRNSYARLFRDKYLNKDKKLKNSEIFKKYIIKNNLINIFGITTTSTITLSLLKKNDIDLFYDWPIDIVIIDEISKSTTPEILSRIVLAKKVIFAGDYKQLPPKCDFSEEECKDLIENNDFNSKFNSTYEKTSELKIDVYDSNNEDKNEEAKKLYKWLEELYKDSFFKQEVQTLRMNYENRNIVPYQNLTVQHRFCNEIMNVVNTFYFHDEQLQMPKTQRNFAKYKLNFYPKNGIECSVDDPVLLIDTSMLGTDICEYFKNSFDIKMSTNHSFDTTSWKNKSKKDISYSSTVNPYNCLIIKNIIDSLFNQNPKLKPSDIGIITMTKSQKTLINQFIDKQYRGIKIDTVDNFQGREAEIIILDFVRAYGKLNNNSVELDRRNLEFYFVNERINVAISRAKSKLIIIGSFKNHYFDNSTIKNSAIIKEQQNFLHQVKDAINKNCILNGKDYKWLEK